MKKETIEEAANKIYPNDEYDNETYCDLGELYREKWLEGAKWQAERMGLMEIELNHTKTLLTSCEKALEDRDKQAERMYSEEDMREAFIAGTQFEEDYDYNLYVKKWFEQYKKK